MSFWKTMAGIGTGIACVAALPVAGPIGAVTAVGAAVGGGIGGLVGYAASEMEEDEIKEAINDAGSQGYQKGKAENQQEIARLLKALKKAEEELSTTDGYFNLLIAMTAVGMACANCDGEIAPEEEKQMLEFVSGVGNEKLPQKVKSKIQDFVNNPPNVRTAFKLAQKVGLNSYELFDEIIEITIYADNRVHEKEIAFREAWNDLKNAA